MLGRPRRCDLALLGANAPLLRDVARLVRATAHARPAARCTTPRMHRRGLGLVFVLGLIACKGKAEEGARGAAPTTLPATGGDPKPGAPIQPDELRVAPEIAVAYGVIAPVGADLGKLEAAARAAGLTDVMAKPIVETQLDRETLKVLGGGALTPADIDGILGGVGVVFLQHLGADARSTFGKAAAVTAELADSVNGWVMDPEAQRFSRPRRSARAFRRRVRPSMSGLRSWSKACRARASCRSRGPQRVEQAIE